MIYLIYGPDELARSEALATLKQTIPPDLADLNISTLDGRKLKVETLIAECEAFPFIAERRIIIVHNILKHQKAGKERDTLRDYLTRLPQTCDLIFVESETIDKRNAIFTYLKKAGDLQECTPKEGNDLLRWIAERAKKLGVTIESTAARHLVEYVGNEGRALTNELGKLASYVGKGGRITAEHIDLLVTDGQEQNLFAFIDQLSQRRRDTAYGGLRRLFADGQAPTYILFMIARQVRILLGVKEFANQRMRVDDIAAQTGQRPFVVRKALEQVRGFSYAELVTFHDRVLELDHATKTGRITPETALEVLVVEMCR